MIPDKPLPLQDILSDEDEREKIILLLSNLNNLMVNNEKGSVCAAVMGDWGSGKTTYLRVLECFYRDYMEYPVVFFEAWKYQEDDNPLVPLILNIRDHPDIDSKLKNNLNKILEVFMVSTISAMDIMLGIIGRKGVESIDKAIERVQKRQLNLRSKYEYNIRLLEETVTEIRGNFKFKNPQGKKEWKQVEEKLQDLDHRKRFVIIIDDLDRLIPEKAFKVIEVLRFYFDIDDVLIVMGINDKILEAHYNEIYGEKDKEGGRRGERFLEKIFHWNYEIPFTRLNDLHLRSLKKVLEAPAIDKVRKILSYIDFITHRKWVKFINRIEKDVSAGKGSDEIEKVLFSAALKELYPEFELFSRRFPHITDVLYGGQTGDPKIDKAMKTIKGDTSFLDFPEENFMGLLEATRVRVEEKAEL